MDDLKIKFKTVFHHSEFEADIRLLSIVVGADIVSVQSEAGQHRLQDAFYQFYLCAQDDYFQGGGSSKEG